MGGEGEDGGGGQGPVPEGLIVALPQHPLLLYKFYKKPIY